MRLDYRSGRRRISSLWSGVIVTRRLACKSLAFNQLDINAHGFPRHRETRDGSISEWIVARNRIEILSSHGKSRKDSLAKFNAVRETWKAERLDYEYSEYS